MKELLLVFTLLSQDPKTFKVEVTGELVANCSQTVEERFVKGKPEKREQIGVCVGDIFTNVQGLIDQFVVPPATMDQPEEDLNPDLMPLR